MTTSPVAEATTLANIDGAPTVLLQIRKQSGTNTVEVVNNVKERLADAIHLAQDRGWSLVRSFKRLLGRPRAADALVQIGAIEVITRLRAVVCGAKP